MKEASNIGWIPFTYPRKYIDENLYINESGICKEGKEIK